MSSSGDAPGPSGSAGAHHGTPVEAASSDSANEAVITATLDNLKTFRHNWWAPILLGVITLFNSWDSIAMAYVMPTLSIEWQLNPLVMGILISACYAGQFLGAVTLGGIAERLGRLPVYTCAAVGMTFLAVACAFAQDYVTLLIFRLIQGIMIGGALPVAVSYINEIAPTRTRGRYFGIFQTLALSGYGVASISSPFVIGYLGWRWMLGLGALPLILIPLVWLTLPESPRWLMRRGKLDAANNALRKLGAEPVDFVEETPREAARRPRSANLFTLFSAPYRRKTLTITLLWFMTMATSFGMTTWVPSIYVKVFHIPVAQALTFTATTSVFHWIALVLGGVLIDRFGRRPMAMGGLICAATPLLIMATFAPTQPYHIFALFFVAQVTMFYGTFALWPYTAESYPTNVRALALGYGSSVGRAASMLMPLFVGFILNEGASIGIVLAVFGFSALGAMLVWRMRTEETAGRPLYTG
ncbi:MFS transporter [Sphingomonas soli]|uniref:MFS transporter n=1 Tax=Sphingomonas soli TaxID=266127 RepID=UPI000830483B|nr:MFS transporter [Sphingomonas soli]